MITIEDLHSKMEDVLREDPAMILAFKDKLVTDDMWEYAIAMDASLFSKFKRPSFRIASVAVAADGFNLNEIDPTLYTGEQYQRLCQIAVEQNPKAITCVPKEFRTDELVGYAYARDPELILSEKKLTDSMLRSIIDHNPALIQYVKNPSDDLIIEALRKNPRVIVHFAVISDRVKDFFEEHYPQYAQMVIHS